MNAFAHLVLIGFLPLALLLFARFSAAVAGALVVVGGFLFLPILSIPMPGIPDYSKGAAISYALLFGMLVFGKPTDVRPAWRWIDTLMVAWILALPLSYLANDYPVYTALSSVYGRILTWGVPYWFARRTYCTRESLQSLLLVVVAGGSVYAPLCLWEIRMSPQLHTQIYGAFQHSFAQMVREGGYRPIVFTEHGLVLALWMATVLLAAETVRRGRVEERFEVARSKWVTPAFGALLLLCRSLGAIGLGALGMAAFHAPLARRLLAVAGALGAAYVLGRVFADAEVYSLIVPYLSYLPEERAASFLFRMNNERALIAHAWDSPIVGWVAEGFRMVGETDEEWGVTSDSVITDSYWVIVFGTSGLLGLGLCYGTLIGSCLRAWRAAAAGLGHLGVGIGLITAVQILDTISNAFVSPVAIALFGVAAGLPDLAAATATEETAPVEEGAAVDADPVLLQPRRRRVIDA